jgi:hypothetical protein
MAPDDKLKRWTAPSKLLAACDPPQSVDCEARFGKIGKVPYAPLETFARVGGEAKA